MNIPSNIADDNAADNIDVDLMYRQSLQYGKDLARIFLAEKAKREKLEIAYQALNAVFNSTPDGLVVLDDTLLIQQTNPAFQRLVNKSEQPLIGAPIADVLVTDTLIPTLQQFAASAVQSEQIELTMTQPTQRSLLANIARLQAGQLRGWVITLHDVSRRKQIEYQKAEFINIAAHELRTPLASVLGYTELLQSNLGDQLSDFDADLVGSILRGGKRLKRIVDELIDFASINIGHSTSEGIKSIAFGGLVNELIAELEPRFNEQNLSIEVDIPKSDIHVVTDQALLRTALYQLLLNAINFNKLNGKVRVAARQNRSTVSIQVSDTGIGIAETDLESIFQPFVQVEDHNTRRTGGMGLGLSIIQRAVAALGGEVSIDSVLDKGTTFNIEIPLTQSVKAEPSGEDLQVQLATSQQQAIAYARDIQKIYLKLKQANHQLQDVNNQLEEANKLKSNFLGLISHELRSPFVAIDFALQTFARYGLDNLLSDQRELFDQVTDGFKSGRKMIDNLVNYAGLLSKQGRLNLENVNMSELVTNTANELQPMAESRGLNWEVELSDDLMIDAGDCERIGEAVWHLMHNAIKFTKRGGQVITRAYRQGDCTVVEVKDTGIGIDREQQTRLWEAFGQGADPLKRAVDGLGLGLALVRYVALAHHGSVSLESQPGVGSAFSLVLPTQHWTHTSEN
jgi:PAS domain S-box-containing protein